MFNTFIGIVIGIGIGLAFWRVPDMIKTYKHYLWTKKEIKQKVFERQIREIVINEIKRLYNGENNNNIQRKSKD